MARWEAQERQSRSRSRILPQHVGAAMIAHGAEHPWLQIAKGHVVG
jgi:hypothetical protein